MFFSLDIAKPVKQEWENIAAAPLLFLERQFVNVGLKSNLTGFLLCAPQSYKSYTSCTVTYGSYWRQCAAVTAVIDSRVAAPCRRFIMDSLGSDIREDNFMQWSTGKWTLPHSRLLINRFDHFLIFISLSSNYFFTPPVSQLFSQSLHPFYRTHLSLQTSRPQPTPSSLKATGHIWESSNFQASMKKLILLLLFA